MKKLEEFLNKVKSGEIPDRTPIEITDEFFMTTLDPKNPLLGLEKIFTARKDCNEMGMWAIVDLLWTKNLANWIGHKRCLEIMSGAGWLAKALANHGVDIKATDNFSWNHGRHKNMKVVYDVENLNAIDAVKKYNDRDLLIISWPPYNDKTVCHACKYWPSHKPIIYIGEGESGCCAPESFWKEFKEMDEYPQIEIHQWWGIHDHLLIGYWNNVKFPSSDK